MRRRRGDAAIAQLPEEIAAGHTEGDDPALVARRVQVRTDSAGCPNFVHAARARNVGFAVVARKNVNIHAAISNDECRRRVQNETMGHRGRKSDPLYRCRRLLTKADERLDEGGRTKLLGLLEAGDPKREVRTAWHAKEVVRSIYDHHDPELASEFVERLGRDLQDETCPIEVRSLGRTLIRWKDQIAAWHRAHVSNGPTAAMNNLIKRIKRVAFGMTRFQNYRIRVLLYAGHPNWDLLATVRPR